MSDGSGAALTVWTTNTGKKDGKKVRSAGEPLLELIANSFSFLHHLSTFSLCDSVVQYPSLFSDANDPWWAVFLEDARNASIISEVDVSEGQAFKPLVICLTSSVKAAKLENKQYIQEWRRTIDQAVPRPAVFKTL